MKMAARNKGPVTRDDLSLADDETALIASPDGEFRLISREYDSDDHSLMPDNAAVLIALLLRLGTEPGFARAQLEWLAEQPRSGGGSVAVN